MLAPKLLLISAFFLLSIVTEDVIEGHKHWKRPIEPFVPSSFKPVGPEDSAAPPPISITDAGIDKVEEIFDPLVVHTTHGVLKGSEGVSRLGKPFVKFIGIPFAKPPVGELRFESPQPVESWNGTLDATQKPPVCAQFNFLIRKPLGQDDCLYLHVYAPKRSNLDEKLPVIAYIHGGAFHVGSALDSLGDYFVDADVIWVAMNYRLGAFGFLDTTDGVVRGNMGLKDQLMALKWIQKNIGRFGGDPDLVTLAGISAGSISVNYHVLSLKSKGLFSKAIIQSGTSFGPIGGNRHPENYKLFVAKFNCTKDNDTKGEIECLRKIDAVTLSLGHNDVAFPFPLTSDTYYTPTVESIKDEDSFLTEDPLEILKSGNYNKVPIMAGVADQELLLSVAALSGLPDEIEEAAKSFETWCPKHLMYKKDDAVTKKIKDFYYKGGSTENITMGDKSDVTSKMFSDRIWNYGLYQFARIHSANAPLFLYYNTFKPDYSTTSLFKSNQTFTGNTHGDDSVLYYPRAYGAPEVGSPIYNLSLDVVDLYSQFLNEDWMNFRTVPWWQVNPNRAKMTYLKIDFVPDIVDDPFDERMKFWESLEGEIKDI